MNRRVLLLACFAACSVLPTLSACGWRLRGSAPLPAAIMPVQIVALDEYTDFYRELRRGLVAAGATLAEQGSQPGAVVRIRGDSTGQRVLTVSARNTPEEYLVFYNIEYAIERGGREIVPMQPLELTATYSYDSKIVLAKQREQIEMQRALARELANTVLRRLGSIKPDAPRA